jgi:hypothetical protein
VELRCLKPCSRTTTTYDRVSDRRSVRGVAYILQIQVSGRCYSTMGQACEYCLFCLIGARIATKATTETNSTLKTRPVHPNR